MRDDRARLEDVAEAIDRIERRTAGDKEAFVVENDVPRLKAAVAIALQAPKNGPN